MVFTNPEGPKVTSSQERQDTAGWALFNETWPPSVETLIIVRQGISKSRAFYFSTISEVRVDLASVNKLLKNSSKSSYGRVLMGRFADQDGGRKWTRHGESHL